MLLWSDQAVTTTGEELREVVLKVRPKIDPSGLRDRKTELIYRVTHIRTRTREVDFLD